MGTCHTAWDTLSDPDALKIIEEYRNRIFQAPELHPADVRAFLGAAFVLGFIPVPKGWPNNMTDPKPKQPSPELSPAHATAAAADSQTTTASDVPTGTVIMAWTNTPVVANFELMTEGVANRSAASKSDWVRVATFGNEHTAYAAFTADYEKCTLCSLWVKKGDANDGVCKNCQFTSKACR